MKSTKCLTVNWTLRIDSTARQVKGLHHFRFSLLCTWLSSARNKKSHSVCFFVFFSSQLSESYVTVDGGWSVRLLKSNKSSGSLSWEMERGWNWKFFFLSSFRLLHLLMITSHTRQSLSCFFFIVCFFTVNLNYKLTYWSPWNRIECTNFFATSSSLSSWSMHFNSSMNSITMMMSNINYLNSPRSSNITSWKWYLLCFFPLSRGSVSCFSFLTNFLIKQPHVSAKRHCRSSKIAFSCHFTLFNDFFASALAKHAIVARLTCC